MYKGARNRLTCIGSLQLEMYLSVYISQGKFLNMFERVLRKRTLYILQMLQWE